MNEGLKELKQVKGIRSRVAAGRSILMSERHYRKIIWTLAISCMAIGYFSMWGANVLIQQYGFAGGGYQTPVWLAWIAFLGLPLAGRVILSQSLKGR